MIIRTSSRLVTNPYDRVHAQLIEKFGAPEREFALSDQLRLLAEHFPDPKRISGLRILDVACGCISGSAEADSNSGTWGPWLCRAVDLLGGYAIGIDIGSVSPLDTFEFQRRDLTQRDALAEFEDRSFDGISCNNFLSSPHLVYRLNQTREQRAALGQVIHAHIKRLLKTDGIVLSFDARLDNH